MPEQIEILSKEELQNLRSIKLINGNDILACILSVENNMMMVKRPCQVFHIVNQQDGSSTIILSKWQAFAENDIHIIQLPAVVSYCRITADFTEYYKRSVTNQIIDENKVKEPPKDIWPEWMNLPLNRTQMN